MNKYYFLRKNIVIKCHESGKKGAYKRTWYRPKIAADGWVEVQPESAVVLEEDLKSKRLGLIPEKVVTGMRDAWREKTKDENPFDEVLE